MQRSHGVGKPVQCAGEACQHNRERHPLAFGTRAGGCKALARIRKCYAGEAGVLVILFLRKPVKDDFIFLF